MLKLKRESAKKTKEPTAEEQVIALSQELKDVKQVLNDMILAGAK